MAVITRRYTRLVDFLTRLLAILIIALSPCLTLKAEEVKIADVLNVGMKSGILTLKHNAMGDIKFKKRIYDGPPRLVFDLLEAKLPANSNFNQTNISNEITSVRVAQFDATTVRIVCEAKTLSALEKIKIENIGQTLVFKFLVGNVKVQDITMTEGDMRIITDGNISPRTILLDSPSRLVLDLIGAELKSKLQEKTFTVGDEQIRVAQFDTSIVRIVFTGPKSHQREVRISDNERQLLVLGEGSKQKQVVESFNKLLAIKISKTDAKETTYQIDAEKKLNYKFIKLHDPERLVIDFVDTKLTDAFGSNLVSETGHVSGLRYGLATLGRPVTRMVIDLKSKNYTEEFKESPTGTQLFIRILGAGQGISSTNPEADKDPNAVPGENKVNGSKVVIDPGHGGYDHGAIYGGHNEKDINLAVASKVEALLKEAGVAAFMTRAEDRFISLAERVEISNNIDPDIFVSLHSNAVVSNPKMAGLQTYFFSDGGYKLAQFTHKQMVDDVGMPDGKIRKANFWVCKYSKSPAVLIEMGFMTNTEEREKLASDRYQADLAKAITKGIIKYLEENS